jgi:hypothetical protein
VLWGLVTLAIAAALIALPLRFGDGVDAAGVAGAVALIVLMAVLLYRRPGPGGSAALLAAMALALVVPAASLVVPGLDRLWLSRAAAALIARHPPTAGTVPTVIGYSEPSLVFLLGGGLRAATPDAVTSTAGDEALVNERESAAFRQALAARGLAARPVDSASGTDYSNGQQMVLMLYRIEKN